jgi:arsenical pump membrane protein
MSDAAIWTICAASIGGVLTRARGVSEWVYASAGALLLTVFGLVPLRDVAAAIGRGGDVYLFLTGMMVLAELARREGVFDWVAAHAVTAARGSRWRLFALVYGVGTIVTVVLSNDATAVVLTPAVAAAVRKAEAAPLPHLLACALIANAASFVLPISNPANLVVFADRLPALGSWIAMFGVPSALAIAVTFAVLAFVVRRDLQGGLAPAGDLPPLTTNAQVTLLGIGVTAAALVAASALNWRLGMTTCAAGAVVYLVILACDRAAAIGVVRSVSWSVLVLVAGLFVLVQGMELTGLLGLTRRAAEFAAGWPPVFGILGAGLTTGFVANAINNLPAGLIAGASVATVHGHAALRAAVAIGIDLGPNLSVTGSLATVLWLIALRREQVSVSAWSFLRVGATVMPPALVLALVSLALAAH